MKYIHKKFDCRPKVDIELDWLITNKCNFDCEYCYPQLKALKNKEDSEKSIDQIVESFEKTGKIIHAIVSGGEPFLFPNFVLLVKALTKKHYISIYSNFSTSNVSDFINQIDPQKIPNLFPAYHAEQRTIHGKTARQDFIDRCLEAQKHNFNVHVIYVLYPTLSKRAESDILLMKQQGLRSVNLKVFKGVFDGKSYPKSYTPKEKNLFEKIQGEYPYTNQYIGGKRNFCGMKCSAGVRFFRVDPEGSIARCASDRTEHGNLFGTGFHFDDKPLPCKAKEALSLTNCHNYLVKE